MAEKRGFSHRAKVLKQRNRKLGLVERPVFSIETGLLMFIKALRILKTSHGMGGETA
jgi:hypothetical protein